MNNSGPCGGGWRCLHPAACSRGRRGEVCEDIQALQNHVMASEEMLKTYRSENSIDTRRELMQVNLSLTEELAQARKDRDSALAEVKRVSELFETQIPVTAWEWCQGGPLQSDEWRLGWDTCRQKLIDSLRRPT